jgi:lipopolysaccharide biosynthesis glycosyltransferase
VADTIRIVSANDQGYLQFLNIPNLEQYINSGVILWNIQACVRDNVNKKFTAFLQKHKGENIPTVDQSVINSVCFNKIFQLPLKYNNQTYMFTEKNYEPSSTLFSQEDWQQGWNDPVVIHYAGGKPWNEQGVEFEERWWEYAKKTPFWPEIKQKYENAYKNFGPCKISEAYRNLEIAILIVAVVLTLVCIKIWNKKIRRKQK